MTGDSMTAVGKLLADYAAWMLGCGATCARIEKNVARMAVAFGVSEELTIMPRHITLGVSGKDGEMPLFFTRKAAPCGINFDINTRLSALSWNVADHHLPVERVRERFDRIITLRRGDAAAVVILAALANASFCRLFGGDAIAMAAVFAATFIGMLLKYMMIKARVDLRLVFLTCAFVSAVICAGCHLFGWGGTPEVAVATSVLYLIPGVPYINSASDLIAGHYVTFMSRFVDACVLTAALSLGLVAGITVCGVNYSI